MSYKRYLKYIEVVRRIPFIPDKDKEGFAEELERRHGKWWAMPMSTYKRCEHLLYYKESLGRPSPYYADLLKISDPLSLEEVLLDLYRTMNIRFIRKR